MRIFVIAMLCMSMSLLSAKKFISEYTYHAGEMDSKISSRTFATEQVKKQVLQQIGTYVSTEVTNISSEANGVLSEMTSSEISVIAAGVVSFSVLEETWNGTEYWIKAQVEADPDDVIKALDALVQKKDDVQKLQDVQARADQALQEAESLRQELKKAKDDLEKVRLQTSYNTKIDKVAAKEWLQKGYANMLADKYDDAIAQYNKAIEADPELALAYYEMGSVLSIQGHKDRALEYFLKAASFPTAVSYIYGRLGMIYFHDKDYQKALDYFTKACVADPSNANYYYSMSSSQYLLGRMTDALASLDIAIKNSPMGYPEAHVSKAEIYLGQQDWDLAINEYNAALRCANNYDPARSYTGLGYAYGSKNEAIKAIENYRKALEKFPESPTALYNLSWIYYQQKSYNDMIPLLTAYLKNAPQDVSGNLLLAVAYSETGDYDKSIAYNAKVLVQDASNVTALGNTGWAYYLKKDYKNALSFYQKVLSIDPKFSEVYYDLGLLYEQTGDNKLSIQNLKTAAQMEHPKAQAKLQEKGVKW